MSTPQQYQARPQEGSHDAYCNTVARSQGSIESTHSCIGMGPVKARAASGHAEENGKIAPTAGRAPPEIKKKEPLTPL